MTMPFHKRIALPLLMSGALMVPGIALAGDASQGMHSQQNAQQDISMQFKEGIRQGKLEAAFAMNDHLSMFGIDTQVKGEKAILKGTVQSEVEKELAKQVALGVSGITDVENNINIDEKSKPSAWQKSKQTLSKTIDDSKITAAVKSKLALEDFFAAMKVDVDTDNNRVTLQGNVDSEAHKALAEQIAKNVEGVRDVQNKLKVKGS